MDRNTWHHLLHRAVETNKYDYGHVLIIGGSPAMAGAPILAARAALRAGAGLVTIASDNETIEHINRDVAEVMTFTLSAWSEPEKIEVLVKNFIDNHHVTAVVIGPGLAVGADMTIRSLIANLSTIPIIIDAQAIRALHGHLTMLKKAAKTKDLIITPHSGEFAFLADAAITNNKSIEEAALREFALKHNLVVVLKHAHTLIANKNGELYANKTGNAGLATAGTGDALSGIIGALTAQGVAAYEAAKMAVYLHGLAGDIAAAAKTEPGMIASDVIEAIPEALKLIDA